MTVKQVERLSQKTGTKYRIWVIDIRRKDLFSGKEIVYRHDSIVQTRRDAEEQQRKVLNAIADGTYWNTFGRKEEKNNKDASKTSVNDFFDEFMKNHCRVHNKHSEVLSKEGIYKRYLKDAFGKLALNEITPRTVDAFTSEMCSRGLHPKTINNALTTLRRMLRYAEEIEIIDRVPRIRQLKAPESKFDFLTFEELEMLLNGASDEPEWHAMIFFAAKTGLRWGELSELRWSDLDSDNGTLRVSRNFSRDKVTDRKNRHAYSVPLTPEALKLLKRRRHIKGELIFCKADGERHTHRSAYVALTRCCRKAGLREIGWYKLRHTFASHLAMRGVSLLDIKELLWHNDLKSTLRYAHLMPEHKHDAVSVLDEPPPVKRQYSGNGEEAAV